MTHDLYLTGKGINIELYQTGTRRISRHPGITALGFRVIHLGALDEVIASSGHALLELLWSPLAIPHSQGIQRQITHAHSGHIKICPRPLPATKAMHCDTRNQTHIMASSAHP